MSSSSPLIGDRRGSREQLYIRCRKQSDAIALVKAAAICGMSERDSGLPEMPPALVSFVSEKTRSLPRVVRSDKTHLSILSIRNHVCQCSLCTRDSFWTDRPHRRSGDQAVAHDLEGCDAISALSVDVDWPPRNPLAEVMGTLEPLEFDPRSQHDSAHHAGG